MISIKIDTKAAVKYIRGVAEKQIPYACMVGLNNTAFKVKDAEVVALEKHLDRPTPFTKRGYEVVKATKQRLVASVRARQVQGEYLKWQVEGGSRRPPKVANVIPAGVGRNTYGNMKAGAVKRMVGDGGDKRRFFSGKPGSRPAGIWQRLGKGKRRELRLMVAYEGSIGYEKRLPFEQVAKDEVTRVFRPEFDKALARALSTPK